METRIEDLELSRRDVKRDKVSHANSGASLMTDILYVIASVFIASRIPLQGAVPYLPAAFNERSIKLSLTVALIFAAIKQFARAFFS